MNKTLFTGIWRTGINKYVPNVNLRNIDMGYVGTDRKRVTLLIEYTTIEEQTEETEVIFI